MIMDNIRKIVHKIYGIMPDKLYLQWLFFRKFHRFINWKDPKTFNEKLQWLKIYNRNPEYTKMVDKYAVKNMVSERIGEAYVIPTYGVWKNFDEINFNNLPNRFVLKCTHDSGGLIICKNKDELNYSEVKERLNNSLKKDYFLYGREWPYKNVPRRIIAEQFVSDGKNAVLPVYKFMCFNGEPKIIQTIQNDKQPNESIDYFDVEWNLLEIKQGFPNSEKPYTKPKKLEEMLNIARVFAKNHPFLRVDMYEVDDVIKFSEFTFYSDGGLMPFEPFGWDEKLGEWIVLPERYK